MLKAMRPLPTQHYWNIYFDRPSQKSSSDKSDYHVQLDQLGDQIESIQDFWRYCNNTPIEQIKMRESLYLFKAGFKPVWEDRRNLNGGSWTFRLPRSEGPEFWTRIQLLAIGEQLQEALDKSDQICGVGLSVRFNSHLVSVWHRDSSKQKSIDGILACVLRDLPAEKTPKPDNYFYKKHSDHAGFKAPSKDDSDKQGTTTNAAAAAAAALPNPDIVVADASSSLSTHDKSQTGASGVYSTSSAPR